MRILVTGANGFIGKNLVIRLKEFKEYTISKIDINNTKDEVIKAVCDADFIFHLAGVNRPTDETEYFKGNALFTSEIIEILEQENKQTPILITSSIQANLENYYGKSKLEAERFLLNYSKNTGATIYIYRLPNIFGKWCRPNYNSAIATFCYNIARDKEVWISDESKVLSLAYIDDVIHEFIERLKNGSTDNQNIYYEIPIVYKKTLGDIVNTIKGFRSIPKTSIIPNLSDDFIKALYSTYLSYLDEENFNYTLTKRVDNRGWLTEIIKSKEFGQMFISTTKPGITRGNHYHHTKVEKFIVVKGIAEIKLRKINEQKVINYIVDGETPQVVDIPPGYIHSITNIGEIEVITLFWANEIFNSEKPDTIFMEV
ncbi:UDP-2-acetamido-2,6-beta-L-arabino-hexul-4-ose reductase [Clostridium cavendishii DSM 21758]|uniref:UDP-2-acetamido-2,6-beta-L-arabino-hexul-4-ose reductase n=1 Tax=Clostridium cavendishii DSM 21758 TaxID=1121302 RepID=A0A1M6JI84_9CLOT|nr:NAD-dependent epimerase/dehydratase family protein [Clostridium cavendishii]SHJ46396.1 UDP-2-acetamido-2,6-beta-L-arabino-hexul-4-ose reductase [Clostridium cavendishii DSM 21758]